jgi:putative FmdB family regulatory protein
MPLYEYECQQCEHTFEILVNSDDTVECPKCHSTRLQRLLSVPAKPPAEQSLPMACNSTGPPCGRHCPRWT